ncbi:hypothetical protein C8Q80DRAFT_1275265 [Daedaleopsis nitida]|nr:hypothetical protein C8Q80DRAFT_1275265 [Daedaleopsis nitida]
MGPKPRPAKSKKQPDKNPSPFQSPPPQTRSLPLHPPLLNITTTPDPQAKTVTATSAHRPVGLTSGEQVVKPLEPERRYNTRKSTRTAHPAVAAGLASRTREDIRAEAAKKKAVEELRKQNEAAVADKLEAGIARLARLDAAHHIASRQREDSLSRPPSLPPHKSPACSGPSRPALLVQSSGASDQDADEPSLASPIDPMDLNELEDPPSHALVDYPSSSDDHEEHEDLDPLDVQLVDFDLHDDHRWFYSDDSNNREGAQPDADEGNNIYDESSGSSLIHGDDPDEDDVFASAQSCKPKGTHRDITTIFSDDDETSAPGHGSSGRKVRMTSPEPDEESADDAVDQMFASLRRKVEKRAKGKALSAKQRKGHKRDAIVGRLEAHTAALQLSNRGLPPLKDKRPRSNTAESRSATALIKKPRKQQDAIRPDWKNATARAIGPPPSTSAHLPTPRSTPASRTPSNARTSRASPYTPAHWRDLIKSNTSNRRNTSINIPSDDDNDDGRDGVNDEDIAISKADAIAASSRRSQLKVTVEDIGSDDDGHLDPMPKRSTKKANSGTLRRVRTAKADMPPEKSRSSGNVPAWIAPYMSTEIIPSVLDRLGAKTNPWDLREHGGDELLQVCQEVMDAIFPDKYVLTKKDVIYKVIQQDIYNWRRGFIHEAAEAIRTEIVSKFGASWRPKEVRPWVEALKPYDSAACWQHPRTKSTPAQGRLASIYMRKMFAWHLIKTQGTVVDSGWPGGALALAAAALEHALNLFSTGKLVPGPRFGGKVAMDATQGWYERVVSHLVKPGKEENFATLIKAASKFAKGKNTPVTSSTHTEALAVFDHSSPPAQLSDLD